MQETILDDFDKNGQQFEFFRDFFVLDQAEFVMKILESANIPYKLEKSSTVIDEAIVGNSLTPKFILRLQRASFQKANVLIKENLVVDAAYVDEHHLNDLTTNELIAILEKPDEWGLEDGVIAQKILFNRGENYDDEVIQNLQNDRLATLRAGKNEPIGQMLLYYLLIMAVSIFFSSLFILAGLGLAWYYWKDTNVDSTGVKYYSFKPETRNRGQIIFFVWLLLVVPFFIFIIPMLWAIDFSLLW